MHESNIGQTIKSVVSILCVIGIIACVIAGFALISQDLGAIGWPVMLAGVFSMAVTYLFLYGFGELVDKTCANNAALLRIEKELEALQEGKQGREQTGSRAGESSRQGAVCDSSRRAFHRQARASSASTARSGRGGRFKGSHQQRNDVRRAGDEERRGDLRLSFAEARYQR